MREIKFRAWIESWKDTGKGKMIPPFNPFMMTDGIQLLLVQEDHQKMQFTGLKDTDKTEPKEIYDKDILCCDDTYADYPTYAEVFWDDEYGMWKADHHDGDEVCEYELWSLLQEFRFVDVAGNTMENPELLKSETQEAL